MVTRLGQTSLQAGGERAGKQIRMTVADVAAIGELPLVKAVSPEFMSNFPVVFGNRQSSHLVRAVAASYGEMRSEIPLPGGRFVSDEDVRLHRRVAFIGSEVQRKLFGAMPPVGETIRVGGQPFEVIGVMEEKVQMSNYNSPRQVLRLHPVDDDERVDRLPARSRCSSGRRRRRRCRRTPSARVREYIANRYQFDPKDERAANMWGSAQAQEITGGIVRGLQLVLTFIGVLTLAIGGVGIMNIMFVNVQERTPGNRGAEGARRHPPRDPDAVSCSRGWSPPSPAGWSGSACRISWSGCSGPRPFLAELLDDTSRITDIHLILSPELVGICTLDPDGRRPGQRAAAGDQGVASRSD